MKNLDNKADFIKLANDFINFFSSNSQEDSMNKSYETAKSASTTNDNGQGIKRDVCENFTKLDQKYANRAYVFCKKIERNFKNIYISKKEERKRHCLHYKYWVYESIMSIFSDATDDVYKNVIVKKYNDLRMFLTDGFIDYKCQYYFSGKNIDEIVEKIEKKYLHDYFNNYDIIKKIIIEYKDDKQDKCKEYLTSVRSLYERYKKEQCYDYYDFLTNNCDDFFKLEDKYNPQILINLLQNHKDETKTDENTMNTVNSNLEHIKDVHFSCAKGFYWHNKKSHYSLICEDKHPSDVNYLSKRQQIFPIYQFAFNISFLLVGVFIIFFLFYKFTPFGSYLVNMRKSKKKNPYNLHGLQTNYSLKHEKASVNKPANNRRTRISYNPI
ncbi:variable surface protein [Plasmodium gonderi]|uniref:Variable surface protein n=1 Tax=Plasmodium gonderi TaxID=77519 RepID=A0A1Y1JKZ4_PLAGO|nr:variable surface protein [Plasmodium gonderi]GAW83199.1 variable surface protein [Plasmodium gonderi]